VIRLVLIEDDRRSRCRYGQALSDRGYSVVCASSALSGLTLVANYLPDAVFLDLDLPDLNASEMLKTLRAVRTVPVITTTARVRDATSPTLGAGADDHLVEPYSVDDADIRLRAVLRRNQPVSEPIMTIGSLVIDPKARSVTIDGRDIGLSRKEFNLLAYLASHADRVVTKRELLDAVWDQPWGGADKTVDVHMSWLRRKLGETADSPRYFQVLRGVGIRMVNPDQSRAGIALHRDAVPFAARPRAS
jgi:DNA-binding response OmpR family regulator